MKSKLKKYKKFLWILVIVIGISLLLFPTVSSFVNRQKSNNEIDSYNKAVSELTDDEKIKPVTAITITLLIWAK